MVLTTTAKDVANQATVNAFDSLTHMAIGTGTTASAPADTTLESEAFRELLKDATKNLSEGYYVFTMLLEPSQGNVTISEVGVFDSASGGLMGTRNLTPDTYTKQSDEFVRILVGVQITT